MLLGLMSLNSGLIVEGIFIGGKMDVCLLLGYYVINVYDFIRFYGVFESDLAMTLR